MEISNEGTGQYFLNKLNVRKIYKNPRKMFHTLNPLQRRRDIDGYIPIVIYYNTRPCTHAGSCYTLTDVILVRSNRGIETSSCFIRFVNKEYAIQIHTYTGTWPPPLHLTLVLWWISAPRSNSTFTMERCPLSEAL